MSCDLDANIGNTSIFPDKHSFFSVRLSNISLVRRVVCSTCSADDSLHGMGIEELCSFSACDAGYGVFSKPSLHTQERTIATMFSLLKHEQYIADNNYLLQLQLFRFKKQSYQLYGNFQMSQSKLIFCMIDFHWLDKLVCSQ